MAKLNFALACLALAMALAASAGAAAEDATPALGILESFASDYATDWSLAEATTFGVRVGETFYSVSAAPPAADGAEGTWSVAEGAPDAPTFYFAIDSEATLQRLARGEINALTLMAKAFSSDVTPMDIAVMEGFEPDESFAAKVIPLTFHFWTRGKPEIVNFAEQATRFTHGANAGIFYYQPGLRSGWFEINPGDHVNADERSRENPFPSMFLMLKGEATARIGGETIMFRDGEMMFVPPGVSHEFFNEGDAPAFGFLFMFGEGA